MSLQIQQLRVELQYQNEQLKNSLLKEEKLLNQIGLIELELQQSNSAQNQEQLIQPIREEYEAQIQQLRDEIEQLNAKFEAVQLQKGNPTRINQQGLSPGISGDESNEINRITPDRFSRPRETANNNQQGNKETTHNQYSNSPQAKDSRVNSNNPGTAAVNPSNNKPLQQHLKRNIPQYGNSQTPVPIGSEYLSEQAMLQKEENALRYFREELDDSMTNLRQFTDFQTENSIGFRNLTEQTDIQNHSSTRPYRRGAPKINNTKNNLPSTTPSYRQFVKDHGPFSKVLNNIDNADQQYNQTYTNTQSPLNKNDRSASPELSAFSEKFFFQNPLYQIMKQRVKESQMKDQILVSSLREELERKNRDLEILQTQIVRINEELRVFSRDSQISQETSSGFYNGVRIDYPIYGDLNDTLLNPKLNQSVVTSNEIDKEKNGNPPPTSKIRGYSVMEKTTNKQILSPTSFLNGSQINDLSQQYSNDYAYKLAQTQAQITFVETNEHFAVNPFRSTSPFQFSQFSFIKQKNQSPLMFQRLNGSKPVK